MTDGQHKPGDQTEEMPHDLERAQTTAADVESAGRSCIVIVGLGIAILILLAIWVLYTTS
jgi:hypothetical protein